MAARCVERGPAMTPAATRRPSDSTVSILRTLVGFPTVSRDPNLQLIEWVRALLAEHGVESHLSRGSDPGKANLFATIGEGQGGVVLSGHTDVVPVEGQAWTHDPFDLVERDGRLHGRGTADMKGFIATVLAKVPALLAARRSEPIHLALSFDEEVGCLGVRHLLDDLAARGVRPHGCVVGEPSNMLPVVGHKTGSACGCTVTGREAHSALAPQGVNAVEFAARLVDHIRRMNLRLAEEERPHDGYEVPCSTLQTGVIVGGHASNIVPSECTLRFDMRTLPWTDPDALLAEIQTYARDELLPEMRAIAPEADIVVSLKGRVPGFATDPEAPLVRYVQRLAGSNAAPGLVTFASEAGLFQKAGVPAMICGPGSMNQGHKADEFITLEQLALCEDFLDRLATTPFKTFADA